MFTFMIVCFGFCVGLNHQKTKLDKKSYFYYKKHTKSHKPIGTLYVQYLVVYIDEFRQLEELNISQMKISRNSTLYIASTYTCMVINDIIIDKHYITLLLWACEKNKLICKYYS